eukprot:10598444-Lingulodinium_polyedra.AAC.1
MLRLGLLLLVLSGGLEELHVQDKHPVLLLDGDAPARLVIDDTRSGPLPGEQHGVALVQDTGDGSQRLVHV